MRTVTIELPKRNLSISADLTDSDGIFFLALLFNDAERKILEEGCHEEAALKFKTRMEKRLAKTKPGTEARKELEDQMNEEITMQVYHQIERKKEVRSLVAWRLLECFPELPESLVYWHDPVKNGIRLDADETMQFFLTIVGTTLTDLGNKQVSQDTDSDIVPLAVHKIYDNPQASQEEAQKSIAELEEQLAALKKLQHV